MVIYQEKEVGGYFEPITRRNEYEVASTFPLKILAPHAAEALRCDAQERGNLVVGYPLFYVGVTVDKFLVAFQGRLT